MLQLQAVLSNLGTHRRHQTKKPSRDRERHPSPELCHRAHSVVMLGALSTQGFGKLIQTAQK